MLNTISWKPIEPFGAELDLDLSKPLTAAPAAEFLQLFREHYLLLLRGQTLTEEDHRRAVSYLGPVPSDGVDMTSNDPTVGLQGSIKLAFHSDLAFAPEPDLGASLYAIDLIDGASSTRFANGVRAYKKLTPALKKRVAGLEVLSVWPLDQTRRNRAAGLDDSDPRCVYPLVWQHFATGDPILYVTEMHTDCIVGLPEAESEALIEQLFSYLYAAENVVEHHWRIGDVAIWDNRATQHARQDVAEVGMRTLRRVSIARRSFLEQFPQFRPNEAGYVDDRQQTSTPGS